MAEELEASLEVLSQLMTRLHIPGNVVETLVDNYRRVLGASTGRVSRAPAVPFDENSKAIITRPCPAPGSMSRPGPPATH